VQGVLQAHQSKPDVIILDFHMPGGGGATVYERLRAAPDTVKTPIIFSTVVTVEEVRARIKLSEHTFFLRKPVGLGQFVAVLGQVLGDGQEASAAVPAPAAGRAPAKAEVKKVPRFHEFTVRVTYADTDKMGIIYYANYLRYFELGRTELMRSLGVRYRDLEVQRKMFLPCVEANCRYLAPSRYDDLLAVRTWISELGKGSVRFEFEIVDHDLGGKRAALGFTRHAVVNDLWRPTRVPADLRALMEPYVGHRPDA